MTDLRHLTTERLRLDAPSRDDLAELFAIYSDPLVWTHFPSLRHTTVEQTERMLDAWTVAWRDVGLGPWIVRGRDDAAVIGHVGCSPRAAWWNLGYRFAAETHGQGLATEAARPALEAAPAVRDVPVVAYLLEHNHASRRVVDKLGLTLQHRGPDAGNPDPGAVRLVYADRELAADQVAGVMGE